MSDFEDLVDLASLEPQAVVPKKRPRNNASIFCLDCGEEIDAGRRHVIANVELCITCQTLSERK